MNDLPAHGGAGGVLVTGAGGFLGRAVLEILEAQGGRPRAFYGPEDRQIRCDLRHCVGDIEDLEALRDLMTGVEAVVHLAGPPAVAPSFEEPAEYLRVHGVGTARVVEACRRIRVPRLVYVSSAEVYGAASSGPVKETDPLRPTSPYAVAKLAGEGVVEACARASGFEAVILRPFSVYGPGASPRGLIPTILRQAARGEEILLADLAPVRDYCFIEDVAGAVVRGVTGSLPEPVGIYNVGSGIGVSVQEVAEMVLRVAGRQMPIRQAAPDRPASASCERLIADPRRIDEDLGWKALIDLEDGLRKTLEAR